VQLGVSSYSYASTIAAGGLDLLGVVDRVAATGADHLEIAQAGAGGPDLPDDPALADAIAARAAARGLPLTSYVIAADFRTAHEAGDLESEVQRVFGHLEAARRLGAQRVRHDVVAWAWRETSEAEAREVAELVVGPCQRVADRAAELGLATMVENHGFFMNDPARVQALVAAVDRPNFSTLVDVGNFLCVDADPLAAVRASLPTASVVHLKDFRVRPQLEPPGDPAAEGWLRTVGGAGLLGSVVGEGDLPLAAIVREVRASGFDGPVTIEFEGPEDDDAAVAAGLAHARQLWAEAA